MRAVAAGMDDALWDPLVVEMEDLFAEMEILDQGRSTRADLERILVIRDRSALSGGHDRDIASASLVEFASFATVQFLIVDRRRSSRRRFAGCLLG